MSRLHRLFAVLGLLFLAAPAMAQEPQAGPSEDYLAAAADLRAEIDRTAFDLDALSLDLAIADPAEIAEALDARMRTEIYAGVLRGGAGALASGAGNPWDQALALTQVLTEAGYETRIAHAELDEATARALIAAATPRAPQPVAAGPGAEAALDRMAEAGSADALAPVRDLFARGLPVPAMPEEAPAQAARIADALGEAAPDGTALDALMLREAADYIWVQSRLSALEDWTDLHLAFTPPGPVTPTSFIDSPIPDAHVHRLEIGLELERREGDRLRRADLMRSQRFPVANLGREAISLAIVPDGGGEGTLAERAAAASFFYPLMNGELAPDARAFTRQGMTVDAGDIAAGMGAGQLFATVGGKLGGALGALGAMSSDEKEAATAAPEATALVLTVRYDPPEGFGERQVVERRIVDRIGAEARSGKNLATLADAPELVGRWALQILPGGIDAAELADRQLARLIETGGAPDATPENPAETATLATYFQAAAEGGAGPDALAYRAEPFIAATTMTPADEGRAVGMDILRTGLRVLKRDGESWRADPAGAMRAGVAETLLESALLDGAAATGFEPQRDGAWAALISTPDLRPASGRNGLKTLDPPAASVEAASGDLARGALIVMAADGSAWWRVDPQSGAALGIDSLGRGGETAEYMMLVDAAITIGFEVYGAYQCAAAGGPQFCCQATNIVWSVVGFGILGAIGEAVVALKWMDEILAASIGISVGAHAGVLGAGGVIPNPFQSLCK